MASNIFFILNILGKKLFKIWYFGSRGVCGWHVEFHSPTSKQTQTPTPQKEKQKGKRWPPLALEFRPTFHPLKWSKSTARILQATAFHPLKWNENTRRIQPYVLSYSTALLFARFWAEISIYTPCVLIKLCIQYK